MITTTIEVGDRVRVLRDLFIGVMVNPPGGMGYETKRQVLVAGTTMFVTKVTGKTVTIKSPGRARGVVLTPLGFSQFVELSPPVVRTRWTTTTFEELTGALHVSLTILGNLIEQVRKTTPIDPATETVIAKAKAVLAKAKGTL